MGKTFSITIPEPLERKLQICSEEKGVSRSRFIGDILSKWEEQNQLPFNKCSHQDFGYCDFFKISCKAPQTEAETCSGYLLKSTEEK